MKVKVFTEYSEERIEDKINDLLMVARTYPIPMKLKEVKFNSTVFENHNAIIVKEFSALVILEEDK